MNPAVILVSPKGARNVGGVARLMGNFGFRDLRIVAPRCKILGLECKKMSMASFDIIEGAKIFETLAEALADRTYAIALSGRQEEDARPRKNIYEFGTEAAQKIHSDDKIALVFGREEWGLMLDELDQCDIVIDIPTTEDRPSINLSSAVSIVLGLIYHSREQLAPQKMQREFIHPEKALEELFFKRVFRWLDRVKFINLQNPLQNFDDLRAMYHRADLSDRDLRILFGILSSTEGALRLQEMETPKLKIQSPEVSLSTSL